MVSCVLVQGTIADYGEWKGFFNTKGAALRGANGSRGGRIFRSGDNPNKVHVLIEWETAEGAGNFVATMRNPPDEMREALRGIGVTQMPEVTLLEEAETFDV